jgi:hypothetical protein
MNKMKGKIIITIFLATILLCLIPFNDTVKALSTTYTYGFEDGVVGSKWYNSSIMKTTRINGSIWGVSVTEHRIGSKSFDLETNAYGFCNFSYSKNSYLTQYKMYNLVLSSNKYFFFYNSTHQNHNFAWNITYNNAIIELYCNGNNWYYLDNIGSTHQISNSIAYSSWGNYIGFNITNTLGDVDYYSYVPIYGSTFVSGSCCYPTGIVNNWRIDRVYMYSQNSPSYIDDINLTISDSYNIGGGGVGGCTDLTQYYKIGVDNTQTWMNVNGYQLMKIYNVYSGGTLKGVSLCVPSQMYSSDSNLNNYTCKILGYPEESATCFYQDGLNYRLFWDCNIFLGNPVLTNQESGYLLYAQFFHRKLVTGFANSYWLVCNGGLTTVDLDSDGVINFKWGNTDEVPQNIMNYDLGASFYLTKTSILPNVSLPDSLGLQNWVSSNATNSYLYSLGQPDGIVCSYILGNSGYTYRIDVNLNGSAFKTYSNLDYPSGVIGFIPLATGRYDFKLYNYHYVYNITAYVSGNLPNTFFIATDPLFTNPYQTYNIYYRYYHLQGFNGKLGITTIYNDSSDFTKALKTWSITVNTSGNITYLSSSLTNEYLTLYVDKSPYNPVFYATHYIKNPTVGNSWDLYLNTDTLEITKGNTNNNHAQIKGFHPFLASNVHIYIDGISRFDVGKMQVFNISYYPHDFQATKHNISLELNQNNKLIILKTVYLTVTMSGQNGNGFNGNGTGLFSLQAPYSYIVGTILIVILTILPIIVTKGQGGLALSFISFILAIIGLVVDVLLGFFPAWSIAVVIVIGAIIILIMWMQRKIAN